MKGEFVTNYDGDKIYMKSGKSIPTNTVIWAAGVTGNIIGGFSENEMFHNRYIVDRFNKLKGFSNIYAIGDISYMETPKYPKGHPQLANVAIHQAKNLAGNFLKKDNEKWKEYEYDDLGSMATVGKHRAVVDLPKFKFQGLLAWYFWMFLHLMLILSVRNKLAIFLNWMWSYFNKDSSLRLIITPKKHDDTEQ
jgi:NADH dehydrogenase